MDVSTAYPTPIKTAVSTDKQKNDKNYDTFLKMMTTQIKNQDPLNPMSSNTLTAMGQVVGWVGKEARLAAPAYFDGATPVTLSPHPAQAATKAVLVVTDQAGKQVSRTELPLGTSDYAWQGRDAQGTALPKGLYTLALESWQGDKVLDTSAVEHYGKITEIRSTADGVSALLPGGVEALVSAITAIRDGAAF